MVFFTFDTDFNYVSTSIIVWSLSIAHGGLYVGTFIIIPEVTGLTLTDVTFERYNKFSGWNIKASINIYYKAIIMVKIKKFVTTVCPTHLVIS